MKLLFLSPQSLPSIGGLQYVVHYWAEELSRRGHRVTLLTHTPDLRGQAPAGSYRVWRNASWWRQWKAMRNADKMIMFNVSLKGLPLVLLSGRPLYISHHTALWYGNRPLPLRQRLKRWVANRLAAGNCACSGYIAAQYRHCGVIHSPYRADVFVPGTLARRPRSLLFAGRLVSDKGADLLLEAINRLQHETAPVNLTIAGDGPDRPVLEAQARRLGFGVVAGLPPEADMPASGNRVYFTGALSQPVLVRMMQTHEIMVVPSRMEPMGMVVAEGLACGARMLVSNQGGMPEVGGGFCRYFESDNAQSLAQALQAELSHPLQPDHAALSRHLRQFTIGYSVDRLEEWLGNQAPLKPVA